MSQAGEAMNNLELKPCPFCGSSGSGDIIVHDYGANAMEPDAFVQCHQCTTTGPFGATAEEAIAAWNRRTESRLAQQGNAGDQEAEHFIQEAIDHAPEPLRRLGEYLGKVLDEDQWKTAERMLLGIAATQANGQGKEAEPKKINPNCGLCGGTGITRGHAGTLDPAPCPRCAGCGEFATRAADPAPYSAPFTTDVPECCGEPETCKDPCQPRAADYDSTDSLGALVERAQDLSNRDPFAADPSVLTASVLPPLPRYYMSSFPYGFQELYTADQMHDYARAALQTAQLSPVPVSVTEQMIDAGIAAGPLENSAIVRTTLLRTFRAMYAASQPSAQTEESA